MRLALDRVGFYRRLIEPSYCSAPQTWQTNAHRLMRDRHRLHILNLLRHHRNADANAVKTIIMTFWIIPSRRYPLLAATKNSSVVPLRSVKAVDQSSLCTIQVRILLPASWS